MQDLHTQLTMFFHKSASARQTRRATRHIQRVIQTLVGRRADAADICQSTMLRLLKARANGADRAFACAPQAKAYLRAAVRSAVVALARHTQPEPRAAAQRTHAPERGSRSPHRVLCEALARLKRAEVPQALARRHRRDHRAHLTEGTLLRARQIEAAMFGRRAPVVSETEAKASRRAARALRAAYLPSDPDPVHRMIGKLVRLDLRSVSHRECARAGRRDA